MCFSYSVNINGKKLQERFSVKSPTLFEPIYYANGFTKPLMPIITNEESDKLQTYNWGLIPPFISSDSDAKSISSKTLNARSETIFEKPSFKGSITSKRCLVLTTGYYEYQHVGKNKYPYLIHQNGEPFAFAGIYNTWVSNHGVEVNTFSVITTDANSFTETIHNTAKRMPVVLEPQQESLWLDSSLGKENIIELLKTNESLNLSAHTVSKKLTNNINTLNQYSYPEVNNPIIPLF